MSEMQESLLEQTTTETCQKAIDRRPNAFLVEYGTGHVKWSGYVSAERETEFFNQALSGDIASFDSTAICVPCGIGVSHLSHSSF
jgi:hypothetical protein